MNILYKILYRLFTGQMNTYSGGATNNGDREAIKLMRKQQRMQERLAAKNSKKSKTGGLLPVADVGGW